MALQIYTVQTAPAIIWFHVVCAATSVVLGAWLFSKRKGTTTHRWVGRIWVLLMLCISISSFQIQANGHLSGIHVLSVINLAFVSAAVIGALKGNRDLHRKSMIGAYAGLVIAGMFTLLPYRMLGQFVFGAH